MKTPSSLRQQARNRHGFSRNEVQTLRQDQSPPRTVCENKDADFNALSDKALAETKAQQCQILSSPNTNLFQSLIRNQVNRDSSVSLRLSTPGQLILSSLPSGRVHCHYSPKDAFHLPHQTGTTVPSQPGQVLPQLAPTCFFWMFLFSLIAQRHKHSLESTAVNFLLFSYFFTIFVFSVLSH